MSTPTSNTSPDLKKKIVRGMLEFLNEEFNHPSTTAESKESLEVAQQCLETAFGVTLQDQQWKSRKSIRELYQEMERPGGIPGSQGAPPSGGVPSSDGPGLLNVDLGPEYVLPPEASEDSKKMAEDFKNLGNEAMRSSNYSEALGHYTKAVELDGRNSVYFCNRAAAYIKLEQPELALRDCQVAIRLQPNYARAYGRMGVAYSSRSKHIEAIVCYKKALQLEPTNETYTTNLRYSQSMLAQDAAQAGGGSPFGLPGMENLMRNPALLNMAQQMMQDPGMQQMIANLMGGFAQENPNQPAEPPLLENLMQMGQTIANSMRAANPELAEQLGVNLGGGGGNNPGNGNNGGGNNPQDNNQPQ